MKQVSAFCFLLLISFPGFTQSSAPGHYLLVGTYTRGKSEGVYVYKFNSRTGKAVPVSSVPASNPSYLAVAPGGKYVYAANEDKDSGAVTAFSFRAGQLHTLNKKPSGGDHPCYVSVDKTGRWVFAGNYTGGNFSVLPVKANGLLGAPAASIAHSGSSVNKERQEKAHVHCTVLSPDNRYLLVSDLGMDQITTYAFSAATGKLAAAPVPFTATTPGGGPRHLAFAPSGKFVYLMEELSGTVTVFSYHNGVLKPVQRIASVPEGFTGFAGSADIHVSPDGRFLYATNRGESNTIAVFSIQPASGRLSLKQVEPVQGKAPRNFNFDPSGNFVLVANMDSDVIVVFKRNKQTGLLTDSGERITVGSPVCLKWIP